MMTYLVNQIIVEEVIPAKWGLSAPVNCCNGKSDPLERGNYRGMKWTDRILNIAERIIDKLIRQQGNIDKM